MKRCVGLLLVLALSACSVKDQVMDEPIIESDPSLRAQPVMPVQPVEQQPESADLGTAYFDYDKAILKPAAKKALRENAEWLEKHPTAKVQVEGHCDERGSDEYNLRLGQKRADAAKAYLIQLGVSADRITTISYGRIRGGSPQEMAKNRRAAFVIVYGN